MDWDERKAFCNMQREGLPQVTPVEQGIGLQLWNRDFYAGLEVYVQTPFGLVGPYKLLHGGA